MNFILFLIKYLPWKRLQAILENINQVLLIKEVCNN